MGDTKNKKSATPVAEVADYSQNTPEELLAFLTERDATIASQASELKDSHLFIEELQAENAAMGKPAVKSNGNFEREGIAYTCRHKSVSVIGVLCNAETFPTVPEHVFEKALAIGACYPTEV